MSKNAAMSMKSRIKQRMDELGLGVAETAKGIVSKSAVYQWLDGSTEPGVLAIVKLADKLKTYEKWLVTGAGPKERGPLVALDPEEAALLLAYKDLSPDTKEAVYAIALQLGAADKKKVTKKD